MSELKIKALDKKTNKIYDVLRIEFNHMNADTSLVYLVDKGQVMFRSLNEVEIKQFTGLKDRNENNIYDGDRLQGKYHYGGAGWFDTGEGDYKIDDVVVFEYGKFKCGGFDLCDVAGYVKLVKSKKKKE